MKMIKGFLLAITGLFIMITLVSLLMPSRVLTARTVLINAPQQVIVHSINDFQQWKAWHPVFMNAPQGLSVSSPSAGLNAAARWSSNGKENKMVITESAADHIYISLQRENENEVANQFHLLHIKDSSGIQVEWRTITKLKWYPWEKFSGIFIDKMTGPGYQEALDLLKAYAEKQP